MTQNGPTLTLHSVMLGVRDIDASLSFYTAKLGLTLKGRFGDFVFLEMDGRDDRFECTIASRTAGLNAGASRGRFSR